MPCFNPRAPCGARPGIRGTKSDDRVSIHAPRVGRDLSCALWGRGRSRFNPRAPCGARHADDDVILAEEGFQSTRPVWGATQDAAMLYLDYDVSIHAPRVGRDRRKDIMLTATSVSIHAPRVGRDHELDVAETRIHCFNPRAPCGARPHVQ